MVSAPTAACAASSAPAGAVSSASKSVTGIAHEGAPATTSRPVGQTLSKAGRNRPTSSAKTSPGLIASKIFVRVVYWRASSEYDGAIGAYGTPQYIAASASRPCSMLFPDR